MPHFQRVALIWAGILGFEVTPRQVVMCMVGLKLAREAGVHDPDNIVDAEGYLSLINEVTPPKEVRSVPTPEQQSSYPGSLPSNPDVAPE